MPRHHGCGSCDSLPINTSSGQNPLAVDEGSSGEKPVPRSSSTSVVCHFIKVREHLEKIAHRFASCRRGKQTLKQICESREAVSTGSTATEPLPLPNSTTAPPCNQEGHEHDSQNHRPDK